MKKKWLLAGVAILGALRPGSYGLREQRFERGSAAARTTAR